MVYLHRHLASIKLGRWLLSEEIVHHIDHNKENNSDNNLEVLSELEHQAVHHPPRQDINCKYCGVLFTPKHSTVEFCTHKCATEYSIKNKEITKELLEELIPKHTWVALGKMFGYSDNGIKKRAKALGCKIPNRKKAP